MMGSIAVRLSTFATMGAVLGVAYLAALGFNVRIYLGSGSAGIAAIVHALRVIVLVAFFTLCARNGALALISSVAGFQIMRTLRMRSYSLEPAVN